MQSANKWDALPVSLFATQYHQQGVILPCRGCGYDPSCTDSVGMAQSWRLGPGMGVPIAKINVEAPGGEIVVVDALLLPIEIRFKPVSLPQSAWPSPDVSSYDNIAATGIIAHKGPARFEFVPPIRFEKHLGNDVIWDPDYGAQLHLLEGNNSNSLQAGRVRRDPSCKESV